MKQILAVIKQRGEGLDRDLGSRFRRPTGIFRILLILAVGIGSLILLVRGIIPSLRAPNGDFANYYTASRLLAEGTSLSPAYRSFPWFQEQIDRVGIHHQVGGLIPHPPTVGLVMLPLVRFDPLDAKRIWIEINAALLLFNIFLLARISRLRPLITALLFLATGYGLINNFTLGQLYLLLQTSILLAIFFYQVNRPILAGLALGLLIPIKYFGALFLLYFFWKRQWKLVGSALSASVAVFLTVAVLDPGAVATFVLDALPHHLSGQIQDPYAVAFQSWNSLFRRLLIPEPDLNPHPPVNLPFLFPILKNLVVWSIAASALFAVSRIRLRPRGDEFLVQMSLICMAALLLSPGGATYHFLLLTPGVVFTFSVLVRQNRPRAAVLVAVLFFLVNLPHYIWLRPLAQGLWTPFAYTRLWLLLALFLFVIWLFRRAIVVSRSGFTVLLLGCLVGFSVTTFRDSWSAAESLPRGIKRIKISRPSFQRNFGLILDSADLGSRRLVFSYCELLENRYRIYSLDGRPWELESRQNQYEPSLGEDDRSLLYVTLSDRRFEIWFTAGRGRPEYLVDGRRPDWRPGARSFAFERNGSIYLYDLRSSSESLLVSGTKCSRPRFAPSGDRFAYVLRSVGNDTLVVRVLSSGKEYVLGRFSEVDGLDFSPNGRWLLVGAGGGILAVGLNQQSTIRIEPNSLNAVSPIWDDENNRIVFLSDRGRGLACRTLFSLPIPRGLR